MPGEDGERDVTDRAINPLLVPLFDELRGERVIVRPYVEEDAAALQEAVAESREHIRPWLPFADDHQTMEDSLIWITDQRARWILRQSLNCAVVDAKTGGYLGGTGLHPRAWGIRAFEIGYWLRVSAEGQGYMTEAVQLLTDFAFDKLGAKRVEIQCDERNRRSANVARRLGYKQEGLLRNEFEAPDGSPRNTLIFSLIPEDRE
jgi:RimJ/RimL family protein N-acetyltransferase